MIRVAIAGDSAFTCRLLTAYVEDRGDCEVVAVAHDARSTMDAVRRTSPDVLTLDLAMPGAAELIERLPADFAVPGDRLAMRGRLS